MAPNSRLDVTLELQLPCVIFATLKVLLRLFLAALLLQQFTGWDSRLSVLAIGLATMLYTYLGGMQAVIWTDLIQFAIYIVGAIIAGVCIMHFLPGGWHELWTIAHKSNKLALLDFSTSPEIPYTIWTGIIGGAFLTMASHGADQMMVQRYLSCRSLTQARVSLILSGLVVLLQFALFLLIGVGLYVLVHQGLLRLPDGTRNDEVFGHFIVTSLPTGIVGLVIAAVLAASMSTLSSSLNSSANAFVADFYQPLRPGDKEVHYMWVSRGMTMVWGLARIAVAMIALGFTGGSSVVDQVLTVAGFTTGMILGLFILGSLQRPVSSTAALAGLVAGFGAVVAAWWPGLFGQFALAWPWFAPIGTVVTIIAALGIDRLMGKHGSLANGRPQPGLDEPG